MPLQAGSHLGPHELIGVSDRHRAMTWATRLKRVFSIDIQTCQRCGGKLHVIANIEAPEVIERILDHLNRNTESVDRAHPSRAPPPAHPPFQARIPAPRTRSHATTGRPDSPYP